ncbi:hypothetical protein [uncultured Muribaculum sp.]|nr:hypothetical protein [uncultured Muribaculum sp.]
MAKDQNLENAEVLIARNNDTGQVGAVTGLNTQNDRCKVGETL